MIHKIKTNFSGTHQDEDTRYVLFTQKCVLSNFGFVFI